MTELPDVAPISDDEILYRRIPASTGWYDPSRTPALEPETFRPNRNDTSGISLSRQKYSTVEQAARGQLHNQILKTTLCRLLRTSQLGARLRGPLRNTYFRLSDVEEVPLTGRLFDMVQLHRNIRFYRFLLHVCRLLYDCLVPDEASGKFLFADFTRDEKRMHRLFEKFLRSFYSREQTAFAVSQPRLSWAHMEGESPEAKDLLPTLNPDICLAGRGRTIILDAKYYRDPLQRHPSGRQSLHSSNLYQIFSYLKNFPGVSDRDTIEGMLVYALADRRLDHSCSLHGHRLRVYTIDLRQHWKGIRRDLLDLIDTPAMP